MEKSELAPKVEATYQAVIRLLIKGADLNNLTVAEITGKAGIGKGTVYDYFSSKEDMIAGALFYELEHSCRELCRQVSREKSLFDRMKLVLVSMDRQVEEISCFARALYVMMDHSTIGCRLREMVENKTKDEKLILDLVRQVVADQMEGLSEEEKSYLTLMVLSKIVCYAMYQLDVHHTIDMESSVMQEMICRDLSESVALFMAGRQR